MKNMPKINRWIAVFFITMALHIIITYFFAISSNLTADILRIVVNAVNAVSGIYILVKVSQRDDMICENKTLMDLIYYKEHSKKQKNFPLTPTLLLVYSLMMVAHIGYMCLAVYYTYFMKG